VANLDAKDVEPSNPKATAANAREAQWLSMP
jgi:hypothetical protein